MRLSTSVTAFLTVCFAAAASAEAASKPEPVEVRAFVNDSCIVADEPYFKPAEANDKSERSLALLGIVIGKIAQVLVQHALSSSAQKMSANAARQDTVYAMTRTTNLYVANLNPAPQLKLNGAIGCMTVVAGKFRPEPAQCSADYVPRTLDPSTLSQPESEWRTSRTDESAQNVLRRADICTDGEPRAVFESRFEFSDDGTAYRLSSAGYRIQSLMGTSDAQAERHVFYTLDINEPGATAAPQHLSTAWVDLGRVSAGKRSGEPGKTERTIPRDLGAPGATPAGTSSPLPGQGQNTPHAPTSTPWLRVPPLSSEARRTYEERTRVQQDTYAQIEALQRAIVRQQRIDDSIAERAGTAKPDVAAGLREQLTRGKVQLESLNAELEARKAEYAELPRDTLQLMPVSIQVGITESRDEKRAMLALAQVINKSSGAISDVAGGAFARAVDLNAPATKDPGAGLASARAAYYDAQIASKLKQPGADQALTAAKARYNAARRALGLPVSP